MVEQIRVDGRHEMLKGARWSKIVLSYESYKVGNLTPPSGGKDRVLRGGSWRFDSADYFRCAFRFSSAPDSQYEDNGFRVALDPAE